MDEQFSLNEAAAIAEIPPRKIRVALEKKSVMPKYKRKTGRAIRYMFSAGDVFFIKVLTEFPFPLSKLDKRSLEQIIVRGRKAASNWYLQDANLVYRLKNEHALFKFNYESFRKIVDRNLNIYQRGKKRIVSLPGGLIGEPVFKGTRIPLQHVAELFRKGVPDREIAEDFPRLSNQDLAYAQLISRIGKKPGRPIKPLEIRRK